MKKLKIVCIVILLTISGQIFGQKSLSETMSEWRRLSIDSLKNLGNVIEQSNNEELLKSLYTVIEQQAEVKNDTVHLIWVYQRMAWYTADENAIKLLNKAIYLAGALADKKHKGDASYFLGAFYYQNNKPQLAIDRFIEAYKIAQSEKYHELIVDALNAIATIKGEYGEQFEAMDLQLESFNYLMAHANKIPNYYETYLISLDNLALSYLQLKIIDSARIYTQKALDWVSRHEDIGSYPDFRILEAQVNYYDGNFIKSRDSILKYFDTMELDGQADLLYYLGMIEGRLGDDKRKLEYFIKMHKTLEDLNFPPIDNTNELYQYLSLNDPIKNPEYLGQLIYYDSLNNITEKVIKAITFQDFDNPRIQAQRANMFSQLASWRKAKFWLWFAVSLLALLLLCFYYVNKRTKLKLHKIKNLKVIENTKTTTTDSDFELNPDIVARTLLALNNWETSFGFLNSSISLAGLAEELQTNSAYLSKIINHHKRKNFSNYLKDLRIEYAINDLKANPEVSFGKSIVQLANRYGFKSKNLFSKSLKDKTGVTPTVFLKRLKSNRI